MVAMIIVWSGLGFLVPIIVLACFIGTIWVVQAITGDDQYMETHTWPFFLAGLIGAPILWFFGNALHKAEDRSAFFFVPVRWWAILSPLFGFWMLFLPVESQSAPDVEVVETDTMQGLPLVSESPLDQPNYEDDEIPQGVGLRLGEATSGDEE